jgi:acetyl esterase
MIRGMSERRSLSVRLVSALLRHPAPWLRLLGSRRPLWQDGRRLHPSLQLLLAIGERTGSTATTTDWPRARAEMRRLVKASSPVRTDVHVVDRRIPGPAGDLGVRVYRPHGEFGVLPGVLYAHGGGFAVGDLETHDPTCRLLSAVSRTVVVAVDYRLAPEHVFPAAVDDVVATWEWMHDNAVELGLDSDAVAVMGDSAGGNLSAALCLESRRLGLVAPAAQCLVYPLVDARCTFDSYEVFAEGYGLSRDGVVLYRETYAPSRDDWTDPRMSPLCADDLSGLPPALVVTAGFDVLRDDGRAYADALAAAGVPTTYRCYDDMMHGFAAILVLDDAAAAAGEIAAEVGRMLRAGPTGPGTTTRSGTRRSAGRSAS